MHDQLSLPIDRKLQNSLMLSIKSSIEERIRQAAVVILQLLYTHFHHEQRCRSSTPLLEPSSPALQAVQKPIDESNNNNNANINPTNNSTSSVKVSALVAHYSGGEISSSTNVCINLKKLLGVHSRVEKKGVYLCTRAAKARMGCAAALINKNRK